MAKNLVIVESPAKAKTIGKYLGKNFKVLASVGHVMDLPKNELGVDIEKNFAPKYVTIRGKKKVIDELKKAASEVDNVYLAPDPDREGEAIAWHIAEQIKKKNQNIYRVQFNEITERGVKDGIAHPGPINDNRVNAQQSRRILDRLVGYLVSPLLWKPLKYGLSAGRVQSVALRLIVEREIEIEQFVPKEWWSIDVAFDVTDGGKPAGSLVARLEKKAGKKFEMENEETATAVLNELKKGTFSIDEIAKKEVKKSAPLPFITSHLQQDAIRKLRFSAKKAMMIAQQLYEGIELGKEGPIGLITYMRTDSTRVSDDAVQEAHGFVEKNYGKEFLSKGQKKAKATKGNVQDAHEAIRPTSVLRRPDDVRKFLNDDQYKLYKLIWERFVASQMADAIFDQTSISIVNGEYLLKATGRVLKFAGYMQVYTEEDGDNKNEGESTLFAISDQSKLDPQNYDKKQHFTQPPARYSEASLVRAMEQEGIGRPSTYASIISTIVEREYVELRDRRFYPTELGRIVVRLLISNFPKVFEVAFTAEMEQDLDRIEEGDANWEKVLADFYASFSQELTAAEKKFTVDLTLPVKCPQCSDGGLTIKYGKNGSFVACSNYPECKFTSDFERQENGEIKLVAPKAPEGTGIPCEKCGTEMVFKRTRFGEVIACPGYPECKNLKNFLRFSDGTFRIIEAGEKIEEECPLDGGDLVVKSGRNGLFIACSNYPQCKHTANLAVEDGKIIQKKQEQYDVDCDECGAKMVLKRGPRGQFLACSNYPDCKSTKSLKSLQK